MTMMMTEQRKHSCCDAHCVVNARRARYTCPSATARRLPGSRVAVRLRQAPATGAMTCQCLTVFHGLRGGVPATDTNRCLIRRTIRVLIEHIQCLVFCLFASIVFSVPLRSRRWLLT